MNLVDASLSFPTVVFSVGLSVALIYWVFVLLGALDINLFGGDAHVDVSGAAKGVGDAITGGAKGGAEALKGGAEALKGGEALKGVDVDADADGDTSLWAALGLGKVPITVALSAVFFVCWPLSLLAMHYAPGLVGTGSWVAPAVLPATLIVGLPLAGLLVRPLGGVFELREGKSNRDYIGHICTITTGRVDEGFGQATIEDGGTVLIIAVRCDRAGALARNDRALIIDFDPERHAYVVEPAADMMPARADRAG
jgi:hypothetical protein